MSDFEVIVNKYEKLVYTVCYRITANHSDALDATQEVFLQAYRHMGIWENDKALTGWLCRVANNKSIDLIRKRKPELSIDEQNDDESPNFQFQSDELTPERALTEAETRKELTEAINALPQEQKEVVVMRYSANLSYEESADILGISVGTVKSRLSRAKEKMKRFILSRT